MGLNFMGLGFTFGAKEEGLNTTLTQINTQFDKLSSVLNSLVDISKTAFSPVEQAIDTIGTQLELFDELDLGDKVAEQVDKASEALQDLERTGGETGLGDALKVGDEIPEAGEEVEGLSDKLKGFSEDTSEGATVFGRMANSLIGGAGKITGAMGWIGMALGPIISGFGQAAESAGGMVDAVAGMPRRAGDAIHRIANEGVNLTNSLEAEAVSLGQTARSVGVNMGYTGERLRAFIGQTTGMAMGLNVGADEAARAIRAMDEAGTELGAMGLRNAQDVARFTSALGVNADVLRNTGLSMRNELGLADDQIGQITSSITSMGQATGDVAGAMNELPQVLQLIRRRRALGDTPEQLQNFASDIAAAAGGLFQFNQDSDLVRQTAQSLAEQLTENRESFRNMFAGAESEFPQLMTELSIVTGSVDQAFDSMTQGPGQFIEAMGQIVRRVRDSGGNVEQTLEFMRGRLQQTFGADQTATLINFWSSMSDSTTATMADIRGATVDLGDLGRQAHTTGRTMDEVLERMRAGFQTAIRRISRQDSRDFLRATRDSLRDLRVAANEAARSAGPLSEVMGLISRSQQLGALALMPEELRGSAVAADELRGQIMPLVEAFTSWGGLLDTVLGYLSIFATDVVSTWGEISRRARQAGKDLNPMEGLGQALDQEATRYAGILESWIGDIEGWVVQVAETFAQLDFGALFETGGKAEEDKGVMGAIRRVLDRLGEVDWERIWKGIETGLNNLFVRIRPWLEEKVEQLEIFVFDRIGEWWRSIDWGAVFSTAGDLGAGLWVAFQPALMQLASMAAAWLADHWLDIFMWGNVALTVAVFALLSGLGLLIIGLVVAPFVSAWALISESWERQWPKIEESFDLLSARIVAIFTDVMADMRAVADRFINWLRSLWDGFVAWFRGIFPQLTSAFDEVLPTWQERFVAVWSSIRAVVATTVNWLQDEVLSPFFAAHRSAWNAISELVSTVWGSISESISGVWSDLTSAPEDIRSGWEGLAEILRPIFESIMTAVRPVAEAFRSLGAVGRGELDSIMATAVRLFGNSINTEVGEDMAATEEVMTTAANNVAETMRTVLYQATVDSITAGFMDAFEQVMEGMSEFSEGLTASFTTLAETISEILTEMFVSALAQAEVTMLGTETAVEGIIGRLRTITEAQARLAEERGAAVSELSRPADEEAMRRRLAEIGGSEVLRAIHYPDWYTGAAGQGGYQRLFVAKMNELREAITGINAGSSGSTLEERRRLIQDATRGVREARSTSRVGGQPGLPARSR